MDATKCHTRSCMRWINSDLAEMMTKANMTFLWMWRQHTVIATIRLIAHIRTDRCECKMVNTFKFIAWLFYNQVEKKGFHNSKLLVETFNDLDRPKHSKVSISIDEKIKFTFTFICSGVWFAQKTFHTIRNRCHFNTKRIVRGKSHEWAASRV